jgi:alcohol dehydrogenase class IV
MNCNAIYYFQIPTKIIHGLNATSKVGEEAIILGIKKALIVTDSGVKGAGLIDPGLKSLKSVGIPAVIFDEVEIDPGIKTVMKGVEVFRSEECNGVIVVGGGSPLCAGKAIALVATNGGSIEDYEGVERYKIPPLPVIGIPTTAGSGSEVSAVFIITDEYRNYKMYIRGIACYPKVAILDPLLLLNIPYWPGMNAGMDALSHAIGACCTTQATPITDSLAIASVVMITKYLASSVLTNDLEAKNFQLIASTMANIACGNAQIDLIHVLSHPLSRYHMAHGLVCGILIPYVMEFNLPVCEDKFAEIAIALGEPSHGLKRNELAQKAIKRIKELYIKIGFPNKLPADIVDRKHIPELARQAMGRWTAKFNKRKFEERDLVEIYHKALVGWN